MGVAFGRVEEEVADARARDMLMFGGHIRKDDAGGDFLSRPLERCGFEVCLAEVGEAQKPEYCLRYAGEDAEPGSEGGGFDLDTQLH
jgi:hypothetical protein